MNRSPASVRYNNPGAQYPGPSARKFGTTGTEIIGGGHKIAVFDDPVKGAAAQFDLLSRGYSGMSIADAIRKWSGGNSSDAYAARIANATGLPTNTMLTPQLLSDPKFAIPFARAAADWEAGGRYPMTDAQWQSAFQMAQGGPVPGVQGPPSTMTPPASNAGPGANLESLAAALGAEPGGSGQAPFGMTPGPSDSEKLAQAALEDVQGGEMPKLTGRRMAGGFEPMAIQRAVRRRLGMTGA